LTGVATEFDKSLQERQFLAIAPVDFSFEQLVNSSLEGIDKQIGPYPDLIVSFPRETLEQLAKNLS
jgi:hypothetical protein